MARLSSLTSTVSTKNPQDVNGGSYRKLKSPHFLPSPMLMPRNSSNKENQEQLTPVTSSRRSSSRRSSIKELLTPIISSKRSSRRGSTRRSSHYSNKITPDQEKIAPSLGRGRQIPVKQGYLYKKSSTSFGREWKRKYVTLCSDGSITYFPTFQVKQV